MLSGFSLFSVQIQIMLSLFVTVHDSDNSQSIIEFIMNRGCFSVALISGSLTDRLSIEGFKVLLSSSFKFLSFQAYFKELKLRRNMFFSVFKKFFF